MGSIKVVAANQRAHNSAVCVLDCPCRSACVLPEHLKSTQPSLTIAGLCPHPVYGPRLFSNVIVLREHALLTLFVCSVWEADIIIIIVIVVVVVVKSPRSAYMTEKLMRQIFALAFPVIFVCVYFKSFKLAATLMILYLQG